MTTKKPTGSLIEIVKKRGGAPALRHMSESAPGLLAHGHTRFAANSRSYVIGTDFEAVDRGRPKGGRRTVRDPSLKVYWRDDTL